MLMLYLSRFLLIMSASFEEILLSSPLLSALRPKGLLPFVEHGENQCLIKSQKCDCVCPSLERSRPVRLSDVQVYVWLPACAHVLVNLHFSLHQGPYPTEDAVDADLINAGEGFPNQYFPMINVCICKKKKKEEESSVETVIKLWMD